MKITDSIIYAGVTDSTIDLFESQYKVPNGITYNSYVIMDEKTAIMDTVDKRGTKQWLKNIQEVLEGKEPDYLVISHMEPDHGGNVKKLCDMYPKMKIVGNAKTFAFVGQFFDIDGFNDRKVTVAEGDELSLGNHKLTFYMAPMVHWPEVMVTYEKTEKVLFSADAFGRFGNFDEKEPWDDEAARYYLNIVGKYGVQVQALLKKAAALDIEAICPLHGPVLRENLPHYIEKYNKWSSYEPEEKGVLVAYASIHGNTKEAALKFADMLKEKGVNVTAMDLTRDDMSEAVSKAFFYDTVILAASTYDGGVFLPMEDFLHHLKSKNFCKRKIGFIENGTWGPVAAKTMKTIAEGFKEITFIEPVVTIKSVMRESTIAEMEKLADNIR
ncbi:MAG: FprA family A-type flavoprotein [Lachnospiraceae bacterium]